MAMSVPNSRYLGIRLPARLERELRSIAKRESNGMSATIRRLLARAVMIEQQQREERGASS